MDLKDKVILISGGSSGIGLAIVKELLKHNVKGIGVADTKEIEDLGTKVLFVKTDVTNADDFEDAFKTTISAFGPLDIVINNAGILSEKEWKQTININAVAVVHGTNLGFKYMGKNNGGNGEVVVNTASIFGFMAVPVVPVYSATKHFVVGFTKAMGTPFYFNLAGIKVLSVCPGPTDTPILDKLEIDENRDGIKEYMDELVCRFLFQRVNYVSEGFIFVLKNGQNGSAWMVEDEKDPYEVPQQFPTMI